MGTFFSPVTETSVARTFSCEHIEFFTKERVVRRDFVNGASPVDRAHMKKLQSAGSQVRRISYNDLDTLSFLLFSFP